MNDEEVTTVEELDALPEKSLIAVERHGRIEIFEFRSPDWVDLRNRSIFDPDWLPARVLFRPETGDKTP